MSTINKKVLSIITVSVVSVLVITFAVWYFNGNSNLQNNSDEATSMDNQTEKSGSDKKNSAFLQQAEYKLQVPEGWKVEEIKCTYYDNCIKLELSKNNYYIEVNTNVIITGGGIPGNPYGGIFSKFEDQTSSLNASFSRTDYTYDGKVLKDYLRGEATFLGGQDQAEKIISNIQVDQRYWVGSAICTPKVSTDDSGMSKYLVSPSQLKTGQRDPDENGKYITIEYTHRAEPDTSVGEDFRNHPVLINRPVAADSSEHQLMLKEMDEIVKTFELR